MKTSTKGCLPWRKAVIYLDWFPQHTHMTDHRFAMSELVYTLLDNRHSSDPIQSQLTHLTACPHTCSSQSHPLSLRDPKPPFLSLSPASANTDTFHTCSLQQSSASPLVPLLILLPQPRSTPTDLQIAMRRDKLHERHGRNLKHAVALRRAWDAVRRSLVLLDGRAVDGGLDRYGSGCIAHRRRVGQAR